MSKGWHNDKKRHQIVSYGAKQRKSLQMKFNGFHAVGSDVIDMPTSGMDRETIIKKLSDIMTEIDKIADKPLSQMTAKEIKTLEELYKQRYELYKFLGLSDTERERFKDIARGIVAQYNYDTSASIQGVEFFNAYSGKPVISKDGRLDAVILHLPHRDVDGNYKYRISKARPTGFNYVMDDKFKDELETLVEDATTFNTLKVVHKTKKEMFDRLEEILNSIIEESTSDDSKKYAKNLKGIIEIIREGKGIDSIVDINMILKKRPMTQIMLFEPIILLGMNDRERELLLRGLLLHEIGHSLFTFDYAPLRPPKLKSLEAQGLSELVRRFMNILEDGRLTRKLINSASTWSYRAISRALMLMAHRFHQNVKGGNPIKQLLKTADKPMDLAYDNSVPLNIMIMAAHFNISIEQDILYDYFYKILKAGMKDMTDKDYKELIEKYLEKHPKDKSLSEKELKEKAVDWYIDDLIKALPLWRFLYEVDVNGDTGYDLIEKAFNSKSTLEEYEYVESLLHRFLVVYGHADQESKPGTGEGEGQGQGQSQGEGGEQQGEGQGEGSAGEGQNTPIDPSTDLDVKSSPDIGDSGNMPDMGQGSDDGSTIGMGSGGDIDTSGSSEMPDDRSDPQSGDVGEKQEKAKEIGNKAKGSKDHEDAKDKLANDLDKNSKQQKLGDESLSDITEDFDGETPSGKESKKQKKGEFGKSRKTKRGQKSSPIDDDTFNKMREDILNRLKDEERRINRDKNRLPMITDVFSNTDNTFYIPTDEEVMRYANSFTKALMKDIERQKVDILSEPQRRGQQIISTRLGQVLISPRTARPFQKVVEVKQLLPPMNIYMLVDTSGSIGKDTLEKEIKVLKGMSIALKRVKKKVGSSMFPVNFVPIAFGVYGNYHGKTVEVVGIDTVSDYFPDVAGITPTGKALSYIANPNKKAEIIKQFGGRVRTGATDVVILLTDGAPTDRYENYVKEIENHRGIIIPIYVDGRMPSGFKEAFSRKDTIIEDVSPTEVPDITRNIFKTIVNSEIKKHLKNVR